MRRPGAVRFGFASCLALLLALFTPNVFAAPPGPPPNALRVTVLDIGQGDGIVIQAPNNKAVLIDAGPTASQPLLLSQLARLGVDQLDLVVASHPHEDHIGGILAVLDRMPVRFFTDPGTTHTTSTYKNLVTKLGEKQVKTRVARKGQTYKLDTNVFLDVLAPREPLITGTKSDLNNNSVTVRLRYESFSMLFQGDTEAEGEARLVEDQIPTTSVYKVGHHGSRSSSGNPLLDRLQAKVAIISCEVGNDYGHPHEQTMKALERHDIQVFRTDQDGQVQLLSDGTRLWVRTYTRDLLTQPLTVQIKPKREEGPIMLAPEPKSAPRAAAPPPAHNSDATPVASDKGGAAADGDFVASQKSKVFHKANCGNAKRISESNRVSYSSRDEAVAAGKEPAKDCKP